MSIRLKPTKKTTIAIIDLGITSVGVALASLDSNPKSTDNQITFTLRQETKLLDRSNFQLFLKNTLETTRSLVAKLPKQKAEVTEVFIFLSSPFYISQTKNIRITREKNWPISDQLIKKILKEEGDKFLNQFPIIYPEIIEDKTRLFENYAMKICLNGYATSKPHGKKVKKLELFQYLTIGSTEISRKLLEIVRENFGYVETHLQSFSFASFNVLRLIKNQPNFLILDISGSLTDLSVITNDYLTENLSFPRGKNHVIEELAQKLMTSREEAYSTIKGYLDGSLNIKALETTNGLLNEIKNHWLNDLEQALEAIMESVILPEQFYVIGDDLLSLLFEKWLQDPRLTKFSLANKLPQVLSLHAEDFNGECKDYSNSKHDPFFRIGALFAKEVLW